MVTLRSIAGLPLVLLGLLLSGRADSRLAGTPLAAHCIEPGTAAPIASMAAAAQAETPANFAVQGPERGCLEQIRTALMATPRPGAPGLDAARVRVLLAAKSEPVHFARRPQPDAHATKAARAYRQMLERTSSPWSMLQRLLPVFAQNVELARSVLLREGYLYAEDPTLAFALVDLVSVQLLYNEPQVYIDRGERRLTVQRSLRGYYVYADGPERGQRARLLLFDRIHVGEVTAPLHHDFRGLRQRLGFDSAKVVHQSDQSMVADLRYGQHWVRSLLKIQGAHLELSCEDTGDLASAVSEQRARTLEKARLLEPLRYAMRAQVEEGLPFDEPRTEYGQQDGALRRAWQRAYRENKSSYELNDDIYYVFNSRGQPLVPQVCIDFIFDTFERAAGSWWNGRGLPRERTAGSLNLASLTELDLRRANSIIDLATSRPEWLELRVIPEAERIPFKYSAQLSRYLTENAAEFQPGDVVLIRGYAPWDKPWKPRVMHMHSFFVYDNDPLSGMPIILAGNPGQPVLQTWQFEAFRTPERSVHYRVRPRLEWLRQILTPAPVSPPPAPLSIDARDPRIPLDIPTPPVDAAATETTSPQGVAAPLSEPG
jgi:hypothetical protein